MQRPEIDTLVDRICAGQANASDMDQLGQLLLDDAGAQAYYLQRIDLHNALRWRMASEATYHSLATLKSTGYSPQGLKIKPRRIIRWPIWMAGAAAALLVAVATQSIWQGSTTDPVARTQITTTRRATQVSLPAKKQPDQPRKEANVIARITDSRNAVWAMPAATKLYPSKYRLEQGFVRLRLASDASLAVQGPAEFELTDAKHVQLLEGAVAVLVPPQAQGFTIHAGCVRVTDSGSEFGMLADSSGQVRVAVFRGEVQAVVDSEYLGLQQTIHLTRKDGMTVDRLGAVTTSIIGNQHRFALLRQSPDMHVPTVANGSFEYPRTKDFTTAAPAGWKLLAHPVANADQMDVSAGIVQAGKKGPKLAGPSPEAPHGRQWAYLNARTFSDGRSTYTSMHQSVGLVVADATYEVQAIIGRPAGAAESAYRISLYAGSQADGPNYRLKTWESPAMPKAGGQVRARVTYHSPKHTSFRDDELFVVIEAVPGEKRGIRQVLIDDIQIELIRKEP